MPQEVVVLSGIGEDTPSAETAIVNLQTARVQIQNLWSRAWDLKWNAYTLASRSIALRDRALYDAAKAQDAEGIRWMQVAATKISDNDKLRGALYGQLKGKVGFTLEQTAWFTSPAGLSVPAKYNKAMGGAPIPKFPVWS